LIDFVANLLHTGSVGLLTLLSYWSRCLSLSMNTVGDA